MWFVDWVYVHKYKERTLRVSELDNFFSSVPLDINGLLHL